MSTLVEQTRALSGSSTDQSNDNMVIDFIKDGSRFVINSIPDELAQFMISRSTASNGNGISITTNKISAVSRAGIECEETPFSMTYAYSTLLSVESMFEATNIFPKYYISNNKIFIKPNPTTAHFGNVDMVTIPSISTTTVSTNLSISILTSPIILFAASMDCMAMSAYWSKKGTSALSEGRAQDALDKARDLIDDSGGMSQGEDTEYYIDQDDVGMIDANVKVAGQEINRALAELRNSTGHQAVTIIFVEKAKQLFEQAQIQLANYIKSGGGNVDQPA